MNTFNLKIKYLLFLFVLVGFFVSFGFYYSAYAQTANLVAIQMQDNGCGSGAGSARYTSNITNTFSSWAGDDDNYDSDCMRILLANMAIPANTDIRIGMRARDINTPCGFLWCCKCGDSPGGTIQYTPWASAITGSAWMPWTTDTDAWRSDQYQISVDSRAMTGKSISSFRLAVQLADDTSDDGGCGTIFTTIQYTPWNTDSTASRWSAWSARNDYNCARILLEPIIVYDPPIVTLVANPTNPAPQSTSTLTFTVTNTVTSCSFTGTNDDSWAGITASGTRVTSALTSTTTYTFACTGPGGTATRTATVYPPIAELNTDIPNYGSYVGGDNLISLASYTVRNNGNKNASVPFVVNMYFDYKRDGWDGDGVDGDFIFATTTAALNAGATRFIAPPTQYYQTGAWRARVFVDATNVIVEGSETNNYSSTTGADAGWDNFDIVAAQPSVTLHVKKSSEPNSSYAAVSSLNINEGVPLDFKWTSRNATTTTGGCAKTFVSGTGLVGTTTGVTGYVFGSPTDESVVCNGESGTTQAIRTIRVNAYPYIPYFVASDLAVHIGQNVTFVWDTYLNDPAQCSFSGPGAPSTALTQQGTTTITIQGASMYTFTCIGGYVNLNMTILPGVFES